MPITLETRSAKTKLKGPSIYVWQPYKNQNVTTVNAADNVTEIAKECDEIKRREQSDKIAQRQGARGEMSPHKALTIKTNIIKLLNTYTSAAMAYKSIPKKLKVKMRKAYKLLTNPVKPIHEVAPLKFHSRLKQTIYNSLMNNKDDVTAITEMVYAKVYGYTKFPVWQSHQETMLEHSLRVVEVCLEAHKNGQLTHIKSMRGYINHCLNEELNAYVFNEQKKLMPVPDKKVSQEIIDLYQNALNEQHAIYESELEKYYR